MKGCSTSGSWKEISTKSDPEPSQRQRPTQINKQTAGLVRAAQASNLKAKMCITWHICIVFACLHSREGQLRAWQKRQSAEGRFTSRNKDGVRRTSAAHRGLGRGGGVWKRGDEHEAAGGQRREACSHYHQASRRNERWAERWLEPPRCWCTNSLRRLCRIHDRWEKWTFKREVEESCCLGLKFQKKTTKNSNIVPFLSHKNALEMFKSSRSWGISTFATWRHKNQMETRKRSTVTYMFYSFASLSNWNHCLYFYRSCDAVFCRHCNSFCHV